MNTSNHHHVQDKVKLLYSAMSEAGNNFEFTERFVLKLFLMHFFVLKNCIHTLIMTCRADSSHNRRIFAEIKKEMALDGTISLRIAHREFIG